MSITCLHEPAQLESIRDRWNELSRGVPTRSWQWLHTWWDYFGTGSELYVLQVCGDQGQVIGLAPWFIRSSKLEGRSIEMLGTGEVCTDYASILCLPEDEERVTDEIAAWLAELGTATTSPSEPRWSVLKFEGVAADDQPVRRLLHKLELHGAQVFYQTAMRCRRVDLAGTWEDFLASLPKKKRRKVRAAWTALHDQKLGLDQRFFSEPAEIAEHLQVLIELHQRRWNLLGQPGCFVNDRFAGFFVDAATKLFDAGNLCGNSIQHAGHTIAADVQFVGGGMAYTYQAGFDPDFLNLSPGIICHCLSMARAIERGDKSLDFMRGNERYKRDLGARAIENLKVRVVPANRRAQLRHSVWSAGWKLKQWLPDCAAELISKDL